MDPWFFDHLWGNHLAPPVEAIRAKSAGPIRICTGLAASRLKLGAVGKATKKPWEKW